MKTYVLFIMFYLYLVHVASGKIINGYEKEIHTARTSLKNLTALTQNRNVKDRIECAKEFILYYQLTERLLGQFRIIAPALYNQIDTIKDHAGRLVDVYVKFVPKSEITMGTKATTNIDHFANDKHAYYSNYGPHTVSVKIVIEKHSLLMLAHEFGHVRYQVPNLAAYVDFFSRHYRDHQMKADYLGHKPNDPSGQSAIVFEKLFEKENLKFIEAPNDRPQNPILIRDQIAKTLELELTSMSTTLLTSVSE